MTIYKTSKAKENILRKIRQAIANELVPMPFPDIEKQHVAIFRESGEPLEEVFAQSFIAAGGNFVFCKSYDEVADQLRMLAETRNWKEVFCPCLPLFSTLIEYKIPFLQEYNLQHEGADACITDCEIAVARTGSFFFSSKQNYGRTAPVYFPVHIVVLTPNQIVTNIDRALKLLHNKYRHRLPSMINMNTGPSRTADIEKTLVTGIHGPKEIFCFLVDQR